MSPVNEVKPTPQSTNESDLLNDVKRFISLEIGDLNPDIFEPVLTRDDNLANPGYILLKDTPFETVLDSDLKASLNRLKESSEWVVRKAFNLLNSPLHELTGLKNYNNLAEMIISLMTDKGVKDMITLSINFNENIANTSPWLFKAVDSGYQNTIYLTIDLDGVEYRSIGIPENHINKFLMILGLINHMLLRKDIEGLLNSGLINQKAKRIDSDAVIQKVYEKVADKYRNRDLIRISTIDNFHRDVITIRIRTFPGAYIYHVTDIDIPAFVDDDGDTVDDYAEYIFSTKWEYDIRKFVRRRYVVGTNEPFKLSKAVTDIIPIRITAIKPVVKDGLKYFDISCETNLYKSEWRIPDTGDSIRLCSDLYRIKLEIDKEHYKLKD